MRAALLRLLRSSSAEDGFDGHDLMSRPRKATVQLFLPDAPSTQGETFVNETAAR